jgi:ATP-dependent Clp protease ATP-binding subunit ClpA
MFERFAETARHVVVLAQEEARGLDADHIGTEHLLIALAVEPSGPAGRALRGTGLDVARMREDARRPLPAGHLDPDALASLGIDLDEVRRRVEAAFGPGALDRRRGRGGDGRRGGSLPFTPVCKKTLELALRHALTRGDNFIGTQHLLLGLLQAADDASLALLRAQDRSADQVRAALLAEIEPGSGSATG